MGDNNIKHHIDVPSRGMPFDSDASNDLMVRELIVDAMSVISDGNLKSCVSSCGFVIIF